MYRCPENFHHEKKIFFWSRDFWEPFENFKISKLWLNIESRDHINFPNLLYNNIKWYPKFFFHAKKIFFGHVIAKKTTFFEKVTFFLRGFFDFFPFRDPGSFFSRMILKVLVISYRTVGRMSPQRLYLITKKYFEIWCYRFLQFLVCKYKAS